MNDMSNMKYRFEKFSRNNVLLSILMVILGLLLILWPGKTLEVAAKLLGIALLVGAAISCFSWYRDRNLPNRSYTTLAIGMRTTSKACLSWSFSPSLPPLERVR